MIGTRRPYPSSITTLADRLLDAFVPALKLRISPVETKALQDLSTVDVKYKATPVNYKNPVSSYIVWGPVLSAGCWCFAW